MKEFIRLIYDLKPDFPPGTNIQYQSCGIAILGEIVERLEGISLPEFLHREIFQPLGMNDTSLGAQGLETDRIAQQQAGVKGCTDGPEDADKRLWPGEKKMNG